MSRRDGLPRRGGPTPLAFTKQGPAARRSGARGTGGKRRTPRVEVELGPVFRAVPSSGAIVPLRGCVAIEVASGANTYRITEAFGHLIIEERGIPGALMVRREADKLAVRLQETKR